MRILVILLLLLVLKPVLASEGSLVDYRLGSGDLINIVVFGEQDLSLEVRLSDAGTVSYPFLGELKVKGLTSRDLEHLLTEGLKGDYLVEPRINVSVAEYRQFFIAGEVASPGGFEYSPGLTLRKAIALAGGFTERASKSKMYVIAGSGNEKGNDNKVQMSLSDLVKPGDTITIQGRGLPHMRSSRGRGSVTVLLKLEIPNKISKTLKNKLVKLRDDIKISSSTLEESITEEANKRRGK